MNIKYKKMIEGRFRYSVKRFVVFGSDSQMLFHEATLCKNYCTAKLSARELTRFFYFETFTKESNLPENIARLSVTRQLL